MEHMTIDSNDVDNDLVLSKALLRPHFTAALSIRRIHEKWPIDTQTLVNELQEEQKKITNGDLGNLEQMLFSQAKTLEAMFNHFVTQVARSETIREMNTCAEIALKANNSCRKTILALSQLKNPSTPTFIKQQNNAVNQQINNAEIPNEIKNSSNELLKEETHEKLDFRRTAEASPIDSKVETLE
jgi:hypothetical protein